MAAPRTSDPEVREIIESDTDMAMAPFIRTANRLVNWLDSVDTDNALDEDMLTEIEMWLAAHFYAHRDQQFQQKTTGGAMGAFQGQTSMVLLSTYWGQTACGLDVTGRLAQRSADAATGVVRRARLGWAGTKEQSPNDNYTTE